MHADPNASQQIENNEINEREKILRRGITHELETLVRESIFENPDKVIEIENKEEE